MLYSPDLLPKSRTHLNVKLCISRLGSIKYLFKYICKGSERVTVEIVGASNEGQKETNTKGIPTID